jgi:hypothetical protein
MSEIAEQVLSSGFFIGIIAGLLRRWRRMEKSLLPEFIGAFLALVLALIVRESDALELQLFLGFSSRIRLGSIVLGMAASLAFWDWRRRQLLDNAAPQTTRGSSLGVVASVITLLLVGGSLSGEIAAVESTAEEAKSAVEELGATVSEIKDEVDSANSKLDMLER